MSFAGGSAGVFQEPACQSAVTRQAEETSRTRASELGFIAFEGCMSNAETARMDRSSIYGGDASAAGMIKQMSPVP
jgi:hypothetical protein